MNTDEMLLYHYYEKHKKLDKYLRPTISYVLLTITGLFLGLLDNKLFIIIVCIFGLWAAVNLILMMLAFIRKCDFESSMSVKLDEVPVWKKELACTLEPDLYTAWLWSIECEEGHIAGDCPLCGAE